MTQNDKAAMIEKLNSDQRWLERAILAIDARQTATERQQGATTDSNGAGWNYYDARKGSYMASYIRRCHRPEGQRLSGRFVQEARDMMKKYAGQLCRIANARKAEKESVHQAEEQRKGRELLALMIGG
jgi:hypothetical protein